MKTGKVQISSERFIKDQMNAEFKHLETEAEAEVSAIKEREKNALGAIHSRLEEKKIRIGSMNGISLFAEWALKRFPHSYWLESGGNRELALKEMSVVLKRLGLDTKKLKWFASVGDCEPGKFTLNDGCLYISDLFGELELITGHKITGLSFEQRDRVNREHIEVLRRLVRDANYDEVNGNIFEGNPTKEDLVLGHTPKLFHFGRKISSKEVRSEMAREGYRPGRLGDLLDFVIKNGHRCHFVAIGTTLDLWGKWLVCPSSGDYEDDDMHKHGTLLGTSQVTSQDTHIWYEWENLIGVKDRVSPKSC